MLRAIAPAFPWPNTLLSSLEGSAKCGAFFVLEQPPVCGMHPFGYPFHSAVGRSPWTARDAPVSLPDAEAGASARARVPAPHDFAGYIWLREETVPLL